MESHIDSRSGGHVSLRDVIHRVNNIVATALAESELALLAGDPKGHVTALHKVVDSIETLRTYLGEVQRREETTCD